MRKNRSMLRETLSQPIIKRRQEMLAHSLQKTIKEQNGSTIKSLASLLNNKSFQSSQEKRFDETETENASSGEKGSELTNKQRRVLAMKNATKERKGTKRELVWFQKK